MRLRLDALVLIALISSAGGTSAAELRPAPGTAVTSEEVRAAAEQLRSDPNLGGEHKVRSLRWTRAHAGTTAINWSVYPGPGGTMIIVEHEEDRSTFLASQATQGTQNEPAAMAAFAGTVTAAPASFLDFAHV